ncbi:MAG: hypothetical protein WCC38_18160 [Pseudonocardiaceae bacterium]
MRKVIKAATLSLLLATATGVAGVEIIGASPAMAQPDVPGSNAAQDPGADQTTAPTSTTDPAPAGGIVPGGVVPGGLALPSVP